jgi:hypothetical protein
MSDHAAFRVSSAGLVLVALLATIACGGGRSPTAATPVPGTATASSSGSGGGEMPAAAPTPPGHARTVYLAGAGDIADASDSVSMENAAKTARLIANLPGAPLVFTAGDNEQSDGSYGRFVAGFDRTWGHFLSRLLPAPGNHDFTPGYFQYFGARADPNGLGPVGYYSLQLSSSWQFISLNSQAPARAGSTQYSWLAQQLSLGAPCTFVVYHEPLQTNSENPPNAAMRDVWNLLYKAGVEVVVNGHNHVYERFPRKNDSLRPDPLYGVRQFTVGTGGYKSYGFRRSEFDYDVRFSGVHGIISFTLDADRYAWEFITITTGTLDSGSEECHGARK